MGATAALLFAPLATTVLAFCPQVCLQFRAWLLNNPQQSSAQLISIFEFFSLLSIIR